MTSMSGLWGPIGVVPPHIVTPEHTIEYLTRMLELSPRHSRWLAERVRASGILRRHTCVPEFMQQLMSDDVTNFAAIDNDPSVFSLEDRMTRYEKEALRLAERACRTLLSEVEIPAEQITHVIWVTCTGFAAPGPAQALADHLGLADDVHHVQVGFMGCGAALQGLRLADSYCAAEPEAVVLLLCVELCTLHFGGDLTSAEQMIIAAHFSDGASAALISRQDLSRAPTLRLEAFTSMRLHEDPGLLTWKMGDGSGFVMGLGRRLPRVLSSGVADIIADLPLASACDRAGWIIHPGGRAIVEAIGKRLGLSDHDLATSLKVLADFGNMSSPTVLFILERYGPIPECGRMLSFGPGPSIEGMSWVNPP